MRVVWAFNKFSNRTIRHIDNGGFLDGRDKTLEEAGVRSDWKGHGTKEFIEGTKPKKTKRNTESEKVERLKKAAKGTRSIKTWV